MIIDGYKIIQGNALDVLRSMESESVQVSVCSPPYYGLRSYKTEPQIWDGDENCDHVWGEYEAKLLHENRQNLDGGTLGNPEYREKLHGFCPSTAAFCQQCSAWRGELGLEPRFDCGRDRMADLEIRDDLTDAEREELIQELLTLGIIR